MIPIMNMNTRNCIEYNALYFLFVNRDHNGPVLIASPDGGMDIEEVAEKTPERLLTLPIDIFEGLTRDKALKVAEFLKFEGDLKEKVRFLP